MKIAIVGPGIMSIPPIGWGAVEILIWDIKTKLEERGHNVLVVNTRDRNQILNSCNDFAPDFVHVQYDEFWDICDHFNCENVAITSHFGYIDQIDKWDNYYHYIMNGFLSLKKTKIFALSQSIANQYISCGYDSNKVKVITNGVRDDLFTFHENCLYPDKSIYLAKIDKRKRQSKFQSINTIYFAGNCIDNNFDTSSQNYLGEWSKSTLYNELTNYANLILLSDGEAHPLVCLEALISGLGLVVSECATANLDTSLPFIDVIPEDKIGDMAYVEKVIVDNRIKSITMRNDIRNYAKSNFSWDIIISKYLEEIKKYS